MRQSGRISLLALGSIVCAVLVVALVFLSRESPSAAGLRFMMALSTKDVDTLTKMSMMPGETDEQIRKQWDFTVNVAEKYYRCGWHIEGAAQPSPTTASVKLKVIHDADHPGSYDELYELPMVKVGEDWKVDVRGMSREFYPGLPR